MNSDFMKSPEGSASSENAELEDAANSSAEWNSHEHQIFFERIPF